MRKNHSRAGFTLVEAIVVIAIVVVGAALLLPALEGPKSRAPRITCVNNLKQIGIAYKCWESDNGDRFPAEVPRSEGGWRDFLTNGNAGSFCWTNYAVLQNDLGQDPRIVFCPSDVRKAATNFVGKGSPGGNGNFGNRNVSYFVGVSASDTYPQSILGGDRNLSPGSTPRNDYGLSPANNNGNDVLVKTNPALPYCWSLTIHSANQPRGGGNMLLGDGSVQMISSADFARYQAEAGDPKLEDQTNSPARGSQPPSLPHFRLVFP